MDGLYLLGFGPRSARAARDLAVALYPALAREPMPSERVAGGGLPAMTEAAAIGGSQVGPRSSRGRATGANRRHARLWSDLLAAAALVAMTIGAAGIPLHRIAAAFGLTDGDPALIDRDWLVLWSIRLPRIAIAIIVGALLAVSGAIMQGLFRNPLADPGAGRRLGRRRAGAAAMIVVGDRYLAIGRHCLPIEVLPVAAFVGALAATLMLYRIATREGRTSIAMFLLGGLAIAALANAGLGLLVFLADDRQLRDINFWMLGSLGGATWAKVAAIAPFLAGALLAMPFIARGLDVLVLGETEAFQPASRSSGSSASASCWSPPRPARRSRCRA